MDNVKLALAAAGYPNTARFLTNATLDDLSLVRSIVAARIEIVGEREALLCAEAVREIDRAIRGMA